jgi:hypothetical protein
LHEPATVESVAGRISAASGTCGNERSVAARSEKFTAETSLCTRSEFAPRDRPGSKRICRLSLRKRTRLAALRQNATATEVIRNRGGRSQRNRSPNTERSCDRDGGAPFRLSKGPQKPPKPSGCQRIAPGATGRQNAAIRWFFSDFLAFSLRFPHLPDVGGHQARCCNPARARSGVPAAGLIFPSVAGRDIGSRFGAALRH